MTEWPQVEHWYDGGSHDQWLDHELDCRQYVDVCPVCGAFVKDRDLHKAFHLSL
jgi:hypothetical protein